VTLIRVRNKKTQILIMFKPIDEIVKRNYGDFWIGPEIPDYTPACRQAGIMKRLHGLQIHLKINRNLWNPFFKSV